MNWQALPIVGGVYCDTHYTYNLSYIKIYKGKQLEPDRMKNDTEDATTPKMVCLQAKFYKGWWKFVP